jgi:hypothetical protein
MQEMHQVAKREHLDFSCAWIVPFPYHYFHSVCKYVLNFAVLLPPQARLRMPLSITNCIDPVFYRLPWICLVILFSEANPTFLPGL